MAEAATPSETVAKAALASELLRRWGAMEPFVMVGLGGAGALLGLKPEEVDVTRTWVKVFDEEIEAVRGARDFTAHLPPDLLPADQLAQANELALRVSGALAERLPRFEELLTKDVSDGVHMRVHAPGYRVVPPPPPPPAATV